MLKRKSQQLAAAGLFLAAGLILPWFTAHAFGVPGTVLLPMHIPVLLCGLVCGPLYGAACGVLVPALSCLLTGMPAAYPMLPIMAAQLFAMGMLCGLLTQRLKLSAYPSLTLSMLSGWAVYGLMFSALTLAGGEIRALPVTAAAAQGLPGIAVQLVLIPVVVGMLKRYMGRDRYADDAKGIGLDEALGMIRGGGASCVVLRDGSPVHSADGRGVSPLLKLYGDDPGKLKDAFVVDKIIGKAAAMILVLGGAKRVYGMVMSVAGREYLEAHGITAEYGRCVDVISNRDRTGICPIEKSVLDTDDPQEGLARIRETVKALMQQAG